MNNVKKRLIEITALLLLTACLASVGVFAAAVGSEDDPLVTMSYLNGPFMTEILEKIGKGSSGGSSSDGFTVVTLKKGETAKLSIGAEVMLRVGTAKCIATSEPGLIDTTAGTSISAGTALQKNHLCMATIDGRGVQATADTVKVLLRGSYTVG